MPTSKPTAASGLGRAVRKLFVSAFVIFTFVIYAVHERLAGPALAPAATPPSAAQTNPTAAQANPSAVRSARASGTATPPPTAAISTQAPPSPTDAGPYRDGQFMGSRVDAFYGWVQVQAVIQNGYIADVKFLLYPNDRRTSQRINNIAMPYLTSEAVQAQSAYVNIISGATLTSEAFARSLQTALQGAQP